MKEVPKIARRRRYGINLVFGQTLGRKTRDSHLFSDSNQVTVTGLFWFPAFFRPCRGFGTCRSLSHGLRRGLDSVAATAAIRRRYRGCSVPL